MDASLGGWVADDTDGLSRAFARAGIGLGALTTDREATKVANTTIAFDALEALEVHADFAAKITFNHVLAILNGVDDLGQLLFAEVFRANGGVNIGFGQNLFRVAGTDAVNVTQNDVDALVG